MNNPHSPFIHKPIIPQSPYNPTKQQFAPNNLRAPGNHRRAASPPPRTFYLARVQSPKGRTPRAPLAAPPRGSGERPISAGATKEPPSFPFPAGGRSRTTSRAASFNFTARGVALPRQAPVREVPRRINRRTPAGRADRSPLSQPLGKRARRIGSRAGGASCEDGWEAARCWEDWEAGRVRFGRKLGFVLAVGLLLLVDE